MIHGFATAARLFNKGIEMNFISSKRSPTPVNDGPLGCVSESAIWSALVFCGAIVLALGAVGVELAIKWLEGVM